MLVNEEQKNELLSMYEKQLAEAQIYYDCFQRGNQNHYAYMKFYECITNASLLVEIMGIARTDVHETLIAKWQELEKVEWEEL